MTLDRSLTAAGFPDLNLAYNDALYNLLEDAKDLRNPEAVERGLEVNKKNLSLPPAYLIDCTPRVLRALGLPRLRAQALPPHPSLAETQKRPRKSLQPR